MTLFRQEHPSGCSFFLSVLFIEHRPNLVGRKPRLLVVLQLVKRSVERTVYTAHVRIETRIACPHVRVSVLIDV